MIKVLQMRYFFKAAAPFFLKKLKKFLIKFPKTMLDTQTSLCYHVGCTIVVSYTLFL